ncbi:MAG: DUF882 domain-containing protein [Deltaproteobacteria bacterium]|nr:DUF882 domain-containing protein [Deltaproteobacteria bacterium]
MKDNIFGRRSFLKGALVGAFLLFSSPVFPAELISPEESPDKMRGDITEEEVPDQTIGGIITEPPVEIKGDMTKEGRLRLYRSRYGERLDVVFRNADGEYDHEALAAINHFMRCHYSDEETEIDIRVIEYLNAMDNRINGGGNEIHVISGYRSREYNDLLRKKSRRVAKYSYHLTGQAIDFRIPGVKVKRLRQSAMKLAYGGVGYYPRKQFVHIDSGLFRYW